MPDNKMFRRDGLRRFIGDHEDNLAEVEGAHREYVQLSNGALHNLQITNQVYHQEITFLNSLMNQLLVQVTVLEGHWDSPLKIPDSLAPIPILPPAGQQLVEINDDKVSDLEDERNQVITEDQVEQFGRVEGEEVRELGIEEEIFKDGETILDVLRQRNLRGNEVLRYLAPQDYNDLGYLSDGPHCR